MSDVFEGAEGIIDTFNADDSIGILKLDDGREVRFGATACKGFLPVVGARVRVDEVRRNARGVKARKVSLLDDTKAHHERAANTYGLRRPSVDEQRSTASLLGWVSVLLDAPLPETQAELDQLSRQTGLFQQQMRLARDTNGDITIEGTGPSIRVYPVPAPIDERRLDLELAGRNFPRGAAYVSLSMGLPDVARKLRRLNPEIGQHDAGALARATLALSQLGPGVVLDLAEGLVVGREDLAAGVADDDPRRPWLAYSTGHDQRFMRTRGLPYLRAGELAMGMLASGPDHTAAILAALAQDLATGWEPQPGEAVGFRFGDEEVDLQVAELGSGWWLTGTAQDESYLAHHAGVWLAAAERFRMRRAGYISSDAAHAPSHYVDIFNGFGCAMITNGLSLVPQPGGHADHGNERVELMCYLDQDGSAQARLLSRFAGMMFNQTGDRPFRPWDGVRNGPESGLPEALAQMILVPREPLVVWPGHQAALLQVVAVSAEEYEQLRGRPDAGQRWLEARKQARDWKRYHQRFNALLQ